MTLRWLGDLVMACVGTVYLIAAIHGWRSGEITTRLGDLNRGWGATCKRDNEPGMFHFYLIFYTCIGIGVVILGVRDAFALGAPWR